MELNLFLSECGVKLETHVYGHIHIMLLVVTKFCVSSVHIYYIVVNNCRILEFKVFTLSVHGLFLVVLFFSMCNIVWLFCFVTCVFRFLPLPAYCDDNHGRETKSMVPTYQAITCVYVICKSACLNCTYVGKSDCVISVLYSKI